LEDIDGIVLPGGESTAMSLIGTRGDKDIWSSLKVFCAQKPTWGTCAGMILLSEKCVGTSAVIENGQSLIGGMDILVCRNYFGSQISSFEMSTPAPPDCENTDPFPGIFIRAPAILSTGPNVEILGTVMATPCKQAAVVLQELERKIMAGEEDVIPMGVVDCLTRQEGEGQLSYKEVKRLYNNERDDSDHLSLCLLPESIKLPGAADGSHSRQVICAVRKEYTLCTAFHPELTHDYRWHAFFRDMVLDFKAQK
jgi:pyridoxal 5'-phosphate synthase glutaminase subunit Pdx2